jgi:hypothetical protein
MRWAAENGYYIEIQPHVSPSSHNPTFRVHQNRESQRPPLIYIYFLFPKTVKPPNRIPNRLFPCFNLRPLELHFLSYTIYFSLSLNCFFRHSLCVWVWILDSWVHVQENWPPLPLLLLGLLCFKDLLSSLTVNLITRMHSPNPLFSSRHRDQGSSPQVTGLLGEGTRLLKMGNSPMCLSLSLSLSLFFSSSIFFLCFFRSLI